MTDRNEENSQREENKDLKVVLSFRNGIASVGVQRPEADPYLESLGHSEMQDVLDAVPTIVGRARDQWAISPTYPAYSRPNTSMGATSAQTAQPADEKQTKDEEDQPTLF